MGSSTTPHSILLVDDDEVFRSRLARAMQERGFEVSTAADVREAVAKAKLDSPELAVVDLRMPGGSGLELVRELKSIDPTTQVIVLTGYGSIATAVKAMRLGASNYVPKPADADEILAAFERDSSAAEKSTQPEPPAPSLARAEWEHINRVLMDCDGNISKAARRLGLHRRTLQRKLEKFPPQS